MSRDNFRISTLDGARGIAAFSILLFHLYGSGTKYFQSLYLAVDFFFVLSGFVLAKSIEKIMTFRDLMHFLWKRLIRIYPMMLSIFLFTTFYDVTLIIKHAYFNEPQIAPLFLQPQIMVASLLILQVFSHKSQLIDFPIWSLSAEWIINITAALIKFFKLKLRTLLIALGILFIAYGLLMKNETLTQIGRASYGFGFGILMSTSHSQRFRSRYHIYIALFFVLLCYYFAINYPNIIYILAAPIFSLLVLSLSRVRIKNLRINSWMLDAGEYSYGFYLWHFPIVSIFGIVSKKINYKSTILSIKFLELALITMVTILCVHVCKKYLEIPMQTRLRKRLT